MIVAGGAHSTRLKASLTQSQIQKIERMSWLKVLVARRLRTEAIGEARNQSANVSTRPGSVSFKTNQ